LTGLESSKKKRTHFKKIQNEYEEGAIISVESLEKLDPKIMYDEEYYLIYKQYEDFINSLKQHGDVFLNDFLAYIEFHETALKMYKHETNEMFTQFAFTVTEQHKKEIEQKKKEFEMGQRLRDEIEREEEKMRSEINDRLKNESELRSLAFQKLRENIPLTDAERRIVEETPEPSEVPQRRPSQPSNIPQPAPPGLPEEAVHPHPPLNPSPNRAPRLPISRPHVRFPPIHFPVAPERLQPEPPAPPVQPALIHADVLNNLSDENIQKIRDLIKKYPEMKDVLMSAMLTESIKKGNLRPDSIEKN